MHLKKMRLPYAILAALLPIEPAIADNSPQGTITADGIDVQLIPHGFVETSGDRSPGLHALNSGTINAASLTVTTRGFLSNALAAEQGGQISVSDSTITSNGTGGNGLFAIGAASAINAKNTKITATSKDGNGVLAYDGASIRLRSVKINSEALAIRGADSHITAEDTDITSASDGISISGGTVLFAGGSIYSGGVGVTLSESSSELATSAKFSGTEIFAKTGGFRISKRISSELENVKIFVNNDGENQDPFARAGILSETTSPNESLIVLDSTIRTDGTAIHGLVNFYGQARANRTAIETHGKNSFGIVAAGYYGSIGSTSIDATDVTITTYGRGGIGAWAGNAQGRLVFNRGSISTQGELAYGILAETSDLSMSGTSVNTVGRSAHGLVAGSARRLDLTAVQIRTYGSDAHGAWLYNRHPYNFQTLRLAGGSQVDTSDAAAIRLSGGSHLIDVLDSSVTGRSAGSDGILLRVEDGNSVLPPDALSLPAPTLGSPVATSSVLFYSDNSHLVGDVVVDSPSANVWMTLSNGTHFTGALRSDPGYQVAQLSLDGTSLWNVRGDSSVGSMAHAGTIAFIAPTSNDFKTLTVTGDYVGNGGSWVFNRALGNDASLGDQLVIQGNSSGTANVSVRNAGGAGALTSEGIRLISVAGQSDATFALQGRAVAGIYDYFLHKGGISTPDDGNWYLRSEVPPVTPPDPPVIPPDPPVVPPNPPITPPIPPVAPPLPPEPPVAPPLPPLPPRPPQVERPEPSAYLANQNAASNMFRHTMHDRNTDPTASTDGGSEATAWIYVRSAQPESQGRGRQVHVDNQLSSVLLGAGRRFETDADGQLQAGVMFGQGRARSDSRSQVTGYTARGVVNGTSFGLYATWLQDARLDGAAYVDSWLQHGRFRNSVQGEGLLKERYRSRSWTGSAEAGYLFALQRTAKRGIYLEPQLQVVHSRYNADRVVEANGTVVENRDQDSTTARLGVRLYTRALTQSQGQVQPFVAVNWWSGGNSAAIAVDGERLRRRLPRDIYEAKAGVQVDLSGGWRGWGQISRQTGGMGFSDVSGQLGLSYSW